MKFLADECCDAPLVEGLRQDGHDVWYAAELAPSQSDEWVLQQAAADERVLLTEDKDFGELVVRLGLLQGQHQKVLLGEPDSGTLRAIFSTTSRAGSISCPEASLQEAFPLAQKRTRE